jgi:pimeloyl-ACP methyl ester carboxylesterase
MPIAVLDAVGVTSAHIVGLSMGGYTALQLAAHHRERVISCTAAGAGSGALKSTRTQFVEDAHARAQVFEAAGRPHA